MKKNEKSDALLEKAITKFPDQPGVYIEFFLNHSASSDLKRRMRVLLDGFERTGDTTIAFFIGNGYLENGSFEKAHQYLDTDQTREYMIRRKIPLVSQLFYEEQRYEEAANEFLDFYRKVFNISSDRDDPLEDLSAQDLILYILILRACNKDWNSILGKIPKTSVHTDMSWTDYLAMIKEEYAALTPAATGIDGDPGEFNRTRRQYYQERIKLVEGYLKKRD